MKKIASFIFAAALALVGLATEGVAFAQNAQSSQISSANPCTGIDLSENDLGGEVLAHIAGGELEIGCVATTTVADIQYVRLGSGPIGDGTAMQIIPMGNFGFATATDVNVQWFPYGANGWPQNSGSGRFSSVGGYPYDVTTNGFSFRFPASNFAYALSFSGTDFTQHFLSAQSPDAARFPFAECVSVNGFPFCNKNGMLFQPNMGSFGTPDYSSGSTTIAIADIVAYGNSPYVSDIANANMLYVLTPNVQGPNTGELLGYSVDAHGNLGAAIPLAVTLNVPADCPSCIAVGIQGIYYWRGSQLKVRGFHTEYPEVPVLVAWPGGNPFAIAVLSANPPVLQ